MSIQRRITAMAALAALMLGASAVPATARPFDLDGNGSFVPAQTATSGSTSVPPSLARVNAQTNASATTAKRQISSGVAGGATSQTGFDWGDAGIGAAGGIGIAMLATGGGLVAVRMRRDHLDPATR